MQDEAVRPQRRAYRRKKGVKARKTTTAGLRSSLSGPNHMKMHGVMVLVDEEFDLGKGATAKAPGQSGVAGHDINCRCYLSRDLITKKEFINKTGRILADNPPKEEGTLNSNIQISEENNYKFDSGESREAIVYYTPDGTKFIFPKNYNKLDQTMTPEKAISLWQQVPDSLRSHSQNIIEFVDYYNPMDEYWRKVYKNFTRSYATGGDKITFYRYTKPHNNQYVIDTYCHEIGHHIDTKLLKSGKRFSESIIWLDAINKDLSISNKKSCTIYGENSACEDFAESIMEYVKDPTKFAELFPNRAKLLSHLFKYYEE